MSLAGGGGEQDSGPALHKDMQEYKSRFKINIASKTLTNNFLFQTKKEPQHYQCRDTVMTVNVTLPEEKPIKLHS
jgi:membrane-bound inhibitor of C-type lysozyme